MYGDDNIDVNEDGLTTVPKIETYDLRERIFTYIKDAKDKEQWDGRTTTRITPTARNLINLVDGDYGIHSKVKTTTALFYIGCFNFIESLEQNNYGLFLKACTAIDRKSLLLPDTLGTTKHRQYHEMIFKLKYVSQTWKETKKNTFTQIDDSDNHLAMNYYNDSRFGMIFDLLVDRFGFNRIDVADMAIFYALNNCNLLTDDIEDHKTAERLHYLVQSNTKCMNESINIFIDDNNIIDKLKR